MTPDETHRDWGRKLRDRRKAMGFTQLSLAEAVGYTQPTISDIEKGNLVPTDELKWRLAGALAVQVAELFPYPAHRPAFPAPRPARAAS